VKAGRPGRVIPPGFVGLSFEYWNLPTYAGTNPGAIDPVFLQLVRNLTPGQQPVIRIGGVSTDHTWYPPPGAVAPRWVQYTLTPQWLSLLHSFVARSNARMILGINFEADDPAIAAREAAALTSAVGKAHIAGLELGNEPELYAGFPWYRTTADIGVKGRSKTDWTPQLFGSQFNSIASTLPAVPLAGPTVGSFRWIAQLGPFLRANPEVRLATIHAYPLKRCRATTHVTAGELLDAASSTGLAALLEPAVRTAHAAGIPLRIAEMNSVSCGGEPGLSDTFAAALWSVDAMFAMANAGIDGVNIHTTPFVSNHLFTVQQAGGSWVGTVYPIYYGLSMFAQAAPPGSRLVPVAGRRAAPLRAWATTGAGGTRVVLINTSRSKASIALRVPGATAGATLMRLTAAGGVTATSGVRFGGESFGTQTSTGLPSSEQADPTVSPSNGVYIVELPAESAALLRISS